MIRSATFRTLALANGQRLAGPHQRRSKTFVRRVDKNDDVYYTLATKRAFPDPNSPVQYDFFEMPNLLLDLDAEGTSGVRDFVEEDEQQMKGQWAVVPRRTAVRARLKQFEEQVYESRRKAHEILSQPLNIWRITSHDILSAALRGTDVENMATQSPNDMPGSRTSLSIQDTIRIENGIPLHATEEDEQLIRWMILRRKSLEQSKQTRGEAASTPMQLAEALQRQTSITGIRRLVFQYLDAGMSSTGFAAQPGSQPDLNIEIREACERVLRQDPVSFASIIETLTFIGNLSARLLRLEAGVGVPLWGLGLKLSAEACLLETTSEWLQRVHNNDLWSNASEASQDVLAALQSFQYQLDNQEKTSLHRASSRQLLFQLLTGIDENEAISADSFRALATLYLASDSCIPAQRALAVYESYISLLGQLGAARMLWKEWRLSAPQARKRSNDKVAALFQEAIRQSARVIAAPNGEMQPDISLEDCARHDYHAIEMQDARTWRQAPDVSRKNVEIGDVSSTLDLPLGEWMKQIEQLRVHPQRART